MEHLEELRKLMRLQGADAERALAGLVRVAAAGGATQVFLAADPAKREVSARFDGRPFSAGELGSVFESFFAPAGSPKLRAKELAAALLSLLRTDPEWVTVSSGSGAGRSLLRLRSLEDLEVETAPDSGSETVVTARERPLSPKPLFGAGTGAVLRERCALSRIPVYLDGKLLPPFDPKALGLEGLEFDSDGVRGWLGVPADPGAPSRLSLSQYGIQAAEASVALPGLQVEGRVNDDRLRLDAAKNDFLRDEAFSRLLARVGAETAELSAEMVRLQCARMESVGEALRDPAALEWWRRRLEGDRGGSRPELEADARRTLWLRLGARLGTISDAPLYFDSQLRPLSLEDLDRIRASDGALPRLAECPPADAEFLRERYGTAPLGPREARARTPRSASIPLPQSADAAGLVPGLKAWFRCLGVRAKLRAADRKLDGLLGPAADMAARLGAPSSQAQAGFLSPERAEGSYELNLRHPLLVELLSRDGGAGALPFAASVVLTGLNRLRPDLTDRADAALQAELARCAIEAGAAGTEDPEEGEDGEGE